MSEILRVADKIITEKDIFPLLKEYQMLMPLAKEIFLDLAIAKTEYTEAEIQNYRQQFFNQYQITSDEQLKLWLEKNQLTQEELDSKIIRALKLDIFKKETWQDKLESYYLKRKKDLDKVIYSLIRTKDMGVAQVLYFRLQAAEQSFADIAKQFSQGAEAQTGGLIGPIELNVPHPQIAQMLMTAKPGEVLPPTRIGEWIVILRLEKFLTTQLDQAMEQRLLNELFNNWLNEQLQQQVTLQ